MNKQENQYKSTQDLLARLAEMPDMVIATAYIYALNYTQYGVDVTKEWTTAIQEHDALSRAYERGYHDAIERINQVSDDGRFSGRWIADTNGAYTDNEDTWECSVCHEPFTLICGTPKDNLYNYCPKCGARLIGESDDKQRNS